MLCYVTTRYVDKHIEIGNDAMSMTTRGDRLKQAREGYFKSARQAAIALGVPVATYNAHEHAQQKGGRDFSPEEAQIYADRFGVKLEHLLMGISDDQPSNNTTPTIPVIGYVEPGDIVHFFREDEIERVRFPGVAGPVPLALPWNAALEMRNNPDYPRWLAYFDYAKRPMNPSLVGQLCVVASSDGKVYLRRVEKAWKRGWYHLVSRNELPIMDVRPIWAARIGLQAPR